LLGDRDILRVPANVNGIQCNAVILDTGANFTTISEEVANELNFEVRETFDRDITSASNNKVEVVGETTLEVAVGKPFREWNIKEQRRNIDVPGFRKAALAGLVIGGERQQIFTDNEAIGECTRLGTSCHPTNRVVFPLQPPTAEQLKFNGVGVPPEDAMEDLGYQSKIQIRAIVCRNVPFDILLGCDAIRRMDGFLINIADSVVHLATGYALPCVPEAKERFRTLFLAENMVISPRTEVIVKCLRFKDTGEIAESILVEGTKLNEDIGLYVARGIHIPGEDVTFNIHLQNTTESEIVLQRGDPIAEMKPKTFVMHKHVREENRLRKEEEIEKDAEERGRKREREEVHQREVSKDLKTYGESCHHSLDKQVDGLDDDKLAAPIADEKTEENAGSV